MWRDSHQCWSDHFDESSTPRKLSFLDSRPGSPLYINGDGVPQDYSQAVVFLTRGAQLKDANCKFTLGLLFIMAKGLTRNVDEAIHWIGEASKQGHEEAQGVLGRMPEFVKRISLIESSRI